MRYGKDHKAETRQQILIQAARHFLADGIAGTAIAGLMAEAGLTHGGFYAHFPSKDELTTAAIESGLRHTRAALAREAAKWTAAGGSGLEGVIRLYLNPRHRDMPEKGCFAALLSQEIARLPFAVRQCFTDEVAALLQLIGDLLPMPPGRKRLTQRQRLDRATMILTGMMGSLQLARATTDARQSKRILELGIAAALQLAGIA